MNEWMNEWMNHCLQTAIVVRHALLTCQSRVISVTPYVPHAPKRTKWCATAIKATQSFASLRTGRSPSRTQQICESMSKSWEIWRCPVEDPLAGFETKPREVKTIYAIWRHKVSFYSAYQIGFLGYFYRSWSYVIPSCWRPAGRSSLTRPGWYACA